MGIRLSLQQQKGRRTGKTTHLGCQVKAIPGLTDIFCEQPSNSLCDVDHDQFHLSTDPAKETRTGVSGANRRQVK